MRRLLCILLIVVAGCSATCSPARDPASVRLYDELVFNIYPIEGCSPSPGELERLKRYLNGYQICSPSDVKITVHDEVPWPSGAIWTHLDLITYETKRAPRRLFTSEDRRRSFFVAYFSQGLFVEPRRVRKLAGVMYGPSSMALWKNQARGQESETFFHEVGHLLSLVGKERDKDHPAHCPDKDCVMYWTNRDRGTQLTGTCLRKLRADLRLIK